MEANNIIEANTAIADFRGWAHSDDVLIDRQEMATLKYHTSWDELMPVVEKIIAYEFPGSSDLPFGPDTPWLRTFGKDAETGNAMVRFNRFGLHEAKMLIEATWQAVVEFSNWHNQNQSK